MSEYTIGDLAKKLNITTRTIRYYDQKGLVKPSRVSESGYRLYSAKQVKQLKLIIFLKELGFSLKDIQKILEDKNGDKLIDLLLEDQLKRNKEETQKLEDRAVPTAIKNHIVQKLYANISWAIKADTN